MKKVETIFIKHPYPHDHSRHAILVVLVASAFFISTDNLDSLVYKLDTNIKWWSIYGCLFMFFFFFSSPFIGKTIEPNYSNFSRWYISWLFIAAVQHLPSFQSMGMDIRMNLSLFLTLFLSSTLVLTAFHCAFLLTWCIGLAPIQAGRRPQLLTIFQNCTVLSIACCVFYSHCGNCSPPKITHEQWFNRHMFEHLFLWNSTSFQPKWPQIHEVKEMICSDWLRPVGSADDYPIFSKWMLYGEKVRGDSSHEPSETISPVYSLWATFIGLYIANSVVERSTGWALTHHDFINDEIKTLAKNQSSSPIFLDMVPWYSGTSADLFKTTFDLLVSVTLFLGRFDMRTMEANMTQAQQNAKKDLFLHNHFSEYEELWFDFMADTGDGGNSTYTIARLLAQPSLRLLNKEGCFETLPRGQLFLIGGDLAYPNPSAHSYDQRLCRPFQYALQAPHWFKPEHIAIKKPELPPSVDLIQEYDGPQLFAIPGNHDWFDGLDTFMRYICHRSWFGGWLLPQEKSYFALELPHGWWVFGLDQALHGDIDIIQFKYFCEILRKQVKQDDSVIIMTHEPTWLLDWYWGSCTGKNVTHLIQDHVQGRCRLRLAGDLHHYMRHSAVHSETSIHVEHLIVNGSGGAFLHPTHVFEDFQHFQGTHYKRESAYPTIDDSRKIALGNIMKFRKKNWRFDVLGGVVYFVLVFSMLPQCHLTLLLQGDNLATHLGQFTRKIGHIFMYMLEYTYVSASGALGLVLFAVLFVPQKVSKKRRIAIGLLHAGAHIAAAMALMLLLELGIETCIRHKLLGTGGFHNLYEWYQSKENDHFPDPYGLRTRIEFWTFGFYPACIKYLMAAFDVPEIMAVARSSICERGPHLLPRRLILIYYFSIFLYYWIFSTPVVSLVFGSYLYISINWFHLHFDEAFSSLRIANYKAFTRCHITTHGDLEVYTLGVDKVPKEWIIDPYWEAENQALPNIASHLRKYPSQWMAHGLSRERNCNVRMIDSFTIKKIQ